MSDGRQSIAEVERRALVLIDDFQRFDDAVALLSAALAESDSASLWCLLAVAHFRRGDDQQALEATSQAIAADPLYGDAYQLHAHGLIKVGRHTEALDAARQATSHSPYSLLSWTALAEAYRQVHQPEDARRTIDLALAIDPQSDDALHTSCDIFIDAAEWDAAEETAQALLVIDPASPRALYRLGHARWMRGDIEPAIESFERCLEVAPQWKATLANLRDAYLAAGRFDDALAKAQRIVEIAPDDSLAWSGLAQAAIAHQCYDDALAAVDRAVDLDPANEFAHRLGACAHWALGHDEQALDAMRLATDHADAGWIAERPWVERAEMEARAGRLDHAETCAKRAAEIAPDSPLVHELEAWLGAMRRDPQRSQRAVAAAEAIDPVRRETCVARAFAAVAREDWSGARDAFDDLGRFGTSCCAGTGLLVARKALGDPDLDLDAELQRIAPLSHNCRCFLLERL